MPTCPDCRGLVVLEKIYRMIEHDGIEHPYESFYKCPKCKQEFDPKDVEE